MQIPETPDHIGDLDLLKRLKEYADGKASWRQNETALGPSARDACHKLHAGLVDLATCVAPLLDNATAKEMDTFTMHDRKHAMKVAHLMWHLLQPERREGLTSPEIGMLVAGAFIHDLGMFLSNEQREERLAPDSDLWEVLDVDPAVCERLEKLREAATAQKAAVPRQRILRRLVQAEEALLCQDTRRRHATRERYEEILTELSRLHHKDPTRIPDIESCLSYEGDSFRDKLIDLCVSHNDSPEMLLMRDESQPERPRFPRDYPVGTTSADLHLVAAALRLADILDFDRERTPAVLYHFFLPGAGDPAEDRSTLEWEKHLAISHWHIDPEAVIFRGRCSSHVVHHAIVHFCHEIGEEIGATRATFGALGEADWPFVLARVVKADIHAVGYHYVPYRFELDDERIYRLLMGGAIYQNPLDAVRELVQNAVDACKLRDALTRLDQPEMTPSQHKRIFIEYREPTDDCPCPILSVRDTGTGMDDQIIERYFLKVGRSYYNSTEFNRHRARLRKADFDFAPVSEFGIGFLACFLLADRVRVETAMWEPIRGDTRKRVLEVHGPARLIRLSESANTGTARLRGTSVTLMLTRGAPDDHRNPPSWAAVEAYLRNICRDLPYRLHLAHVCASGTVAEYIDPEASQVQLSPDVERNTVRIPVDDAESGLQGEIAIIHPTEAAEAARRLAAKSAVEITEGVSRPGTVDSVLLRGGFRVGSVPGLPNSYLGQSCKATLRITWRHRPKRRYALPNLARDGITGRESLADDVVRIWLKWMLDHVEQLDDGMLDTMSVGLALAPSPRWRWLEEYSAYDVFKLATNGWHSYLKGRGIHQDGIDKWERGEGAALSLGIFRSDLVPQLLDLVLPSCCRLQMGPEARFAVTPPSAGWRAQLQTRHDFIGRPLAWGRFVEYVGRINDAIFYHYP
ncbi:MAG: ATP-binding protein, partial [Planctomycetes bacterium]|nr:ATP-binding protein [Planctomycetota bacterium]